MQPTLIDLLDILPYLTRDQIRSIAYLKVEIGFGVDMELTEQQRDFASGVLHYVHCYEKARQLAVEKLQPQQVNVEVRHDCVAKYVDP